MGFINMIRICPESGILITDEESWYNRMKRTFYTNQVFFPVSVEFKNRTGLEMVYSGIGTPSFQSELAKRFSRKLEQSLNQDNPVTTLKDAADVLCSEMNQLTIWWKNNHLKFLFGFDIKDFNRGFYYNSKKEKININSPKIKNAVKKILDSKTLPGQHKFNHGMLIGYDKNEGFNGFTFKGELGVSSQMSAGFDAMGTGKYTSCGIITKYLNNQTLDKRRSGLEKMTAIYELVKAAVENKDLVNESGGFLHLVYINRIENSRIHISNNRSKLIEESVRMSENNLMSQSFALKLIEKLIFTETDLNKCEELFWKNISDKNLAGYILRGYKIDAELETLSKPGRRSKNTKVVK